MVKIEESWKNRLNEEFEKPYFLNLTNEVKKQYADKTIPSYPPGKEIFAAFDNCPFEEVKVVIIGQDPYHGPGQANGLCFSVKEGVRMPPSLINIFKEVSADTGAPFPKNGDLSRWAKQGVLLLNSVLTVNEGRPKSHAGLGWETFTDNVIKLLSEQKDNLVFILWGSDAIKKGEMIDKSRHLILTSPHPSPLSASRGFFGNHHFSKTNEYLLTHGKNKIIW